MVNSKDLLMNIILEKEETVSIFKELLDSNIESEKESLKEKVCKDFGKKMADSSDEDDEDEDSDDEESEDEEDKDE